MTSAPQTFVPNVLWAQRKAEVYITIDAPEISITNKTISSESIVIEGFRKADQAQFKLNLNLFAEISIDDVDFNVSERNVFIKASKKDRDAPYWPRLTKSKLANVHTDFSKWMDEDEENAVPDFGGMDMSSFGPNFGGLDGSSFGGSGMDQDFSGDFESQPQADSSDDEESQGSPK